MKSGFSIFDSRQHGKKTVGRLFAFTLPSVPVLAPIVMAIVGNPLEPEKSQHVFVEVLLGLLRALKKQETKTSLESLVNTKIQELSQAIQSLALPEKAIPDWMHKEFDENDLLLFISAAQSFFDQGKI